MAASKQSGPRVLFQHQLRKRRHKRKPAPRPRAPELTVAQILGWADDWHARTGRWPIKSDGRIVSGLGETWAKINSALRQGLRGLPGGSSLPRLLAQHRAVSNRKALPHFTIAGILRWADGYHQRTGNWPNRDSGPVAGDSRETWFKVDRALQNGGRGLSGRSSLAKVLARYRGVRNPANLAGYSIQAILRWADAYRDRHGRWPVKTSGPIGEAPGETWYAVTRALEEGCRGLPGGSSLAQFLEEHRGARHRNHLPEFSPEQILGWAQTYQKRTGRWPNADAGLIPDTAGDTWAAVDNALRKGTRGCPGGSSLSRLLARHYGMRNHMDLPPLTVEQILAWADAHHARTGRWPLSSSGAVLDAPGVTWNAIQNALSRGVRGLAGGSTLARLLAEERGVPNRLARPRLTIPQILAWADAHKRRTGRRPTRESGPLQEAPEETWSAINAALRAGCCGLPPGSSLAQLLTADNRGGAPDR